MVRRIGILGGTFDPVHIGHLRAAIEVLEMYALDHLLLVPSAIPPHRDFRVTADQRLAMVRLATEGVPGIFVDDRELRRDRPSYTLDTLLSLREELAEDDRMFLILGWDAYCGLPTWYRWQELLDHCHLIVLQRPDTAVDLPPVLQRYVANRLVQKNGFSTVAGQVTYLSQPVLDISATVIRQHLAQGRSVRFLVPDRVISYIHEHRLYASSD